MTYERVQLAKKHHDITQIKSNDLWRSSIKSKKMWQC